MRLPRTPVVAALAAALVIGAGGGAAAYSALGSHTHTVVRQVTVDSSSPASSTSSLSVGQIYRRAYKGVVEISVTSTQSGSPFGGSQTQRAQGSGFVYDTHGDVIYRRSSPGIFLQGIKNLSIGVTYHPTEQYRVGSKLLSESYADWQIQIDPSRRLDTYMNLESRLT